jgi:hypothetical protein
MAEQIIVNVDDPADLLTGYGAGAKVRLERAADAAFTSPTEVSTQTLVAGTTQYEFWDAAGTPASYYRYRISDTGGTTFSSYTVLGQPGAPTAYASVDALRELLRLPDDSRNNLLADLLVRVTDKINLSLGFDFFRHPAVSGTETRTFDGDDGTVLTVTQGILSLTTVRVAGTTGGDYSSLTTTDWKLRWPVQAGGPYLALELTGTGNFPAWYSGFDTVELTGVFGYPSIPPAIEQATLYWAADLYRLGAGGGSPLSATGEEFGQARFAGGMPRITWETLEDYRARHKTWVVA